MRTIRRTTQFKRDYKRETRGRHSKTLEHGLRDIISLLISDTRLLPKYRDHPLAGEWKDFRDCHVHPDLVLRKPDAETLELIRLGSHSELGF